MKIENKDITRMYSMILTLGLMVGMTGCANSEQVSDSTDETAVAEETTVEETSATQNEKDNGSDSTAYSNQTSDDDFIKKEDIKINDTISNSSDGGHAIEVDGKEESYSNVAVAKTGEADGDEADFYGENSAIFATNKATLNLNSITVDTNGTHANAVFSYGEGTTVNISDSYIYTSGNCSGGLMTTGGGTMNANNLTIVTDGNSSAAIRSDRGGGTVTVTKGSYTTNGTGSPAIYSTADITVNDATLTSTASQGVVVEGQNSVTLNNVILNADNNKKNSDKSDYYQAVMIYQSMSGDADKGTAAFTMKDGKITNKNGDIFFINNTVATIDLNNVTITNEDKDGIFLRAQAAGWGNEGSNGGNVTLNATKQTIDGDVIVDSVSTLNMYLKDNTTFTGAINTNKDGGEVYVEISDGSVWNLTADSYITSLTCDADSINLNGHKLYVDGKEYSAGTKSTGTSVEANITTKSDKNSANSNESSTDSGKAKKSDSSSSTDSGKAKKSDSSSSADSGKAKKSGSSSSTDSGKTKKSDSSESNNGSSSDGTHKRPDKKPNKKPDDNKSSDNSDNSKSGSNSDDNKTKKDTSNE
ncbi:MAG: hypothetical protein K6G88_07655 [Lachnospiraceae bacterium]|nr:hypothetical protein [Lachnospiraceae bacterium]